MLLGAGYKYSYLLNYLLTYLSLQCSVRCGEAGDQTRLVWCASDSGDATADARCDGALRPSDRRPCDSQPCTNTSWIVSQWSGVSQPSHQASVNPLDSKGIIIVPHLIIRSWYTGCYIWYSEERPAGRAATPPISLFAVPNVTAHPSTVSIPINVLLYDGPLLCGFNVAIKSSKKRVFS